MSSGVVPSSDPDDNDCRLVDELGMPPEDESLCCAVLQKSELRTVLKKAKAMPGTILQIMFE